MTSQPAVIFTSPSQLAEFLVALNEKGAAYRVNSVTDLGEPQWEVTITGN